MDDSNVTQATDTASAEVATPTTTVDATTTVVAASTTEAAAPAAAVPAAPAPVKKAVMTKPPRMTEVERIAQWRDRLLTAGFSPEATNLIVDYAKSAITFELDDHGNSRQAGGLLVTIFSRFARRLNELPELNEDIASGGSSAIIEFLREMPSTDLGNTVEKWRSFRTNGAQRSEVDKLLGFAGKRQHELSPMEKFVFSIRDAAWPSKKEEEKGIGGSFLERLVIFMKAIARLFMIVQGDLGKILGSFYHELVEKMPDWVETTADGTNRCKKCGSAIAQDENGAWICTNVICDHNIAPAATSLAASFMTGQATTAKPPKNFGPDRPPASARPWKNRTSDDSDGELPPRKKSRKGKRFHEREPNYGTPEDDAATTERVTQLGGTFSPTIGDSIGNALDGLTGC